MIQRQDMIQERDMQRERQSQIRDGESTEDLLRSHRVLRDLMLERRRRTFEILFIAAFLLFAAGGLKCWSLTQDVLNAAQLQLCHVGEAACILGIILSISIFRREVGYGKLP